MFFKRYRSQMNNLKADVANSFDEIKNYKVSKRSAIRYFMDRAVYSVKLIFTEREIIVFALLQWIVIILGYYLWVGVIDIIPAEFWKRSEGCTDNCGSIGDVIITAWSFICVGLVTFPLGILSSCMGVAHFFHKRGEESTILKCLAVVLPRSGSIWLFSWIDGWWTLNRMAERMDRKVPVLQRAFKEALYYAWKIITVPMLPVLLNKQGIGNCTAHLIDVLRHKIKHIIILRIAYSALCWVVGILGYISSLSLFFAFPNLLDSNLAAESQVFAIFFWIGVPILISAGLVILILRPIFLISAFDIYSDYIEETNQKINISIDKRKVGIGVILFAIFCGFVIYLCLQKDKIQGKFEEIAVIIRDPNEVVANGNNADSNHFDGDTATHPPIQNELQEVKSAIVEGIDSDKYKINLVFEYKILARVLSKKEYDQDPVSEVSKYDFVLGWQGMSLSHLFDNIKIIQENRGYKYQNNNGENLSLGQESRAMVANTHIISANNDVADILKQVSGLDMVEMEGYLVDVSSVENKWVWKSSRIRDDEGKGSSEIMLVTKIRIK